MKTSNMFGARGPLRAPDEDGSGGGQGQGDERRSIFTPEQQAAVDRIAAEARASGERRVRASIERESQAKAEFDRRVDEEIARRFPERRMAAAPSTSQPSAVNAITTGGLVDIYTMTPEQFATMSSAQMRQHHELNLAAALTKAGTPRVPAMPTSKKK